MATQTKSKDYVVEVLGVPPAEVARLVADKPSNNLCIGIDLTELKSNVGQVVTWISGFQAAIDEISSGRVATILPPPIAVFGPKFTPEETDQLRSHGAVVFDQSISSNADCKSLEALMERLTREAPLKNLQLQPDMNPAAATTPPNRSALNSFPVGVTERDVNEYLAGLNS
jgi:hypothetical protein